MAQLNQPFPTAGTPFAPPAPGAAPAPAAPGAMPAWGAPIEASGSDNIKAMVKKNLSIVGYIAGKYNYLSKTVNNKEAKKMYDEEYKRRKANSASDSTALQYKVVEEDRTTGELTETGTVAELKDSFSMGAFKAILQDKYAELKERGTYTVKMAEKSAEFYILDNAFAAVAEVENADDRVKDAILPKVAVLSENGSRAIIKPKDLCELLLNINVPTLTINRINEQGMFQKAGIFSVIHDKKEKDGKSKIVLKPVIVKSDSTKATTPGDLRLAYAVNKSYKGDPVTPAEVLNEEAFGAQFPEQSIADLATLKKLPKAEGGESPSKKEEIPYADQINKWSVLGVTEDMLNTLRSKKQASKSTVSISELENGFAAAVNAFQQYKGK